MIQYIKKFEDIRKEDVSLVGGKNASLGEMFTALAAKGVKVPDGFASTAFAFRMFMSFNRLEEPVNDLMRKLDRQGFTNLRETGAAVRKLFLDAVIPEEIAWNIRNAYTALCNGASPLPVAVRSSATAEDLPEASFAGQHESYLNITGADEVLTAMHRCFASMYTDRAIKYREDHGFPHSSVYLSVGVQLMVRSDLGCSGVGFTLEPESGFRNIVHLAGVWGLGENIVQGSVTPDEFLLFKPALLQDKNALVQKRIGSKKLMMVYGDGANTTMNMDTPPEKQEQFVLNDEEITQLGKWALIIEDHYRAPMDIEWAKDGTTQQLYILQARPETVHSRKDPLHITEYRLEKKAKPILSGQAVGAKAITGKARLLASPKDAYLLREGEIVVTDMTSPDWDPVLKKAGGIVTNKGGRTSHASIVARELDVPAVVGTGNGTDFINDGQVITVSCCEGKTGHVYDTALNILKTELDTGSIKMPSYINPMLILGDPDKAFRMSFYPNEGVGLLRMEFIINHFIKVHPMALVKFDELKDEQIRNEIELLTKNHPDKKAYFIDRLSQGIGTIAAAFHPKDVIVRLSDFKTNEYAALLGGKDFEPYEANPMLGFRGASRYYHPLYQEGFLLECAAIKKAREEMGLMNIKVMIPFCRTVKEAEKVLEVMSSAGLQRGVNGLQVYIMAEIPSNIILAKSFAALCDGFSIGSNDLTQLTLGVDRDSSLLADIFSEQNEAVKKMIATLIHEAHDAGVRTGLCGQAPSDIPDFAKFLVIEGIDSISFNPDALISGIANIVAAEKELDGMLTTIKPEHETTLL